MWLSVISVFVFVLIPIIIVLFFIYRSKFSNLKTTQSLRAIFENLNGKTTKELKSIQSHSEPMEKHVAALLLAHKYMTIVLIVIGILITAIIGVISINAIFGLGMV